MYIMMSIRSTNVYIMKLLYMYITIATKTGNQKHVARKANFGLYGLLTNVNKSLCYKIIYVSIIKCFKYFTGRSEVVFFRYY